MVGHDRLQPGGLVAALAAAKEDRRLVADEPTAAVGEDERTSFISRDVTQKRPDDLRLKRQGGWRILLGSGKIKSEIPDQGSRGESKLIF